MTRQHPPCPLCSQPGGRVLEQDALARLVAPAEGALPGTQRLILQRHAAEFSDLSPDERISLMEWLARAEHDLRLTLQPDKVNLASLGNSVPHLHWHLIPRWVTDPRWPDSPWSPPRAIARAPLGDEGDELLIGDWQQLGDQARPVRQAVFVEEQGVPAEEEWDWQDEISRHAVALHQGRPVATGRLLSLGGHSGVARIGRMAVMAERRGKGLGREVLLALRQEACRLGIRDLVLHAQVHAQDFYARYGFEPEGEVFDECGISHRLMQAQASSSTG